MGLIFGTVTCKAEEPCDPVDGTLRFTNVNNSQYEDLDVDDGSIQQDSLPVGTYDLTMKCPGHPNSWGSVTPSRINVTMSPKQLSVTCP